jgi:uncharacterized coiled-coil protein SlyX
MISDDSLLSECLPMLKVSDFSHSNQSFDSHTNHTRLIELEEQFSSQNRMIHHQQQEISFLRSELNALRSEFSRHLADKL